MMPSAFARYALRHATAACDNQPSMQVLCAHEWREQNKRRGFSTLGFLRLTAAFSRSQPTDSQYRRTSSRFCCKALFCPLPSFPRTSRPLRVTSLESRIRKQRKEGRM